MSKVPASEYPPVELTIEADHVAAFAQALGLDPADGMPPTYAAVYALGVTASQLFADPIAAVDLSRLLHAEQEFFWERHPQIEEKVVAQGRIVSDIERRGMRFLSFETRCSVEGSPLCRSKALFVIKAKK
ncbi:MAG: FAS1-like dehydratase domain-containing protein [Candidatus Dormibacteraceae bacterium]